MRSRMASGTLGRPSAKRSPFQSGVYLIRSSLVKMPGWPNASPAAHRANNRNFIVLENMFQRHLQLTHGDCRPGDGAESWRRGVGIRSSPHRVIQDVKRFKAELQRVPLGVRHLKFFVSRKIERENSRPDGGIASDIAERAGVRQ